MADTERCGWDEVEYINRKLALAREEEAYPDDSTRDSTLDSTGNSKVAGNAGSHSGLSTKDSRLETTDSTLPTPDLLGEILASEPEPMYLAPQSLYDRHGSDWTGEFEVEEIDYDPRAKHRYNFQNSLSAQDRERWIRERGEGVQFRVVFDKGYAVTVNGKRCLQRFGAALGPDRQNWTGKRVRLSLTKDDRYASFLVEAIP